MDKIITGDQLAELKKMPAGTVDLIVTTPDRALDDEWLMQLNRVKKPGAPIILNPDAPEHEIEAFTVPGDVVLDPFLSNVAIALVTKRLRRRFIGIESNACDVKMALNRLWQLQLELEA